MWRRQMLLLIGSDLKASLGLTASSLSAASFGGHKAHKKRENVTIVHSAFKDTIYAIEYVTSSVS